MKEAAILETWDLGRREAAGRRRLVLLSAAYPEVTAGELAQLPVGRANLLLLQDRRATFGTTVEGEVHCPACGERLEVTVDLADVVVSGYPGCNRDSHSRRVAEGSEIEHGGFKVRYRLPSTADLEAAAGTADAERAGRFLLGRCVVEAGRDGEPVAAEELPAEVVDALEAELSRCDPMADLTLAVTCAGCGHRFEPALDPAALYWPELEGRARRLLSDVHRLATAYGWSEREILDLGPARRAAYLELAR